jgi:glycosyltransferase involved in cell wall biosynthesis
MKKIKKSPDISVIVCTYNHGKWIERCLRSLYHQEFVKQEEYEIILVDDKSVDFTQKVLKNLKRDNLRIFTNKKNLGLSNSINKAIKLSLGRYIVRVDSDDYVARNFLYLTKLFLNLNREFQAVAVDYYKVDNNEIFISKNNCMKEQIACGVMFRKECLFDIGLYNPKFKMREGHELRKRFEKKHLIGHLNLPLYKYRFHENNRSNNLKKISYYEKKLDLK